MNGSIAFPHLGIYLEHVVRSFSIGPLTINCYGIIIAAAMVTGILLVTKIADATGQNGEDYFDILIIAVLLGVLCARAYYVIFSWDYYRDHLTEIINLRQGGLAIYGGVIGGVSSLIILAKRRHIPWKKALDTAVVGLVWGQVAGRWGNFFNREAFGDYTDNLLAMRLPVTDIRSYEITDKMRQHIQQLGGVDYVQVHPTFLYESMWNIGVLILLLCITFLCKKRFDGMVFLCYLLCYGAGRIWIEGLRTDQLLFGGTGIPVSQLLSLIFMICACCLLVIGVIRARK